MATGYTCDIEKGQSFQDFVMHCATAFGPCISLRDKTNKTIPDKFEVDPSYKKDLIEAEEKLKKLNSSTEEELKKAAEKKHKEEERELQKRIKGKKALKIKYEKMLKKALDWKPPTNSHQDLKKFMKEQILTSMKFDCVSDFLNAGRRHYIVTDCLSGKELKTSSLLTPNGYKEIKTFEYERKIKIHKATYEKEVEKVKKNNKWISELRNSLEPKEGLKT